MAFLKMEYIACRLQSKRWLSSKLQQSEFAHNTMISISSWQTLAHFCPRTSYRYSSAIAFSSESPRCCNGRMAQLSTKFRSAIFPLSTKTSSYISTKRHCFTLGTEHDPSLVDLSRAPPEFDATSVLVFPNIISEGDADVIISEIEPRVSGKRYQRGHWDAVITGYREVEMFELENVETNEDSPATSKTTDVLKYIRQHLYATCFAHSSSPAFTRWLPCHAIDLKSDGKLTAHVDSVRFSGEIVAGLSMLSSSIMRLRPSKEDVGSHNKQEGALEEEINTGTSKNTSNSEVGLVDVYLPPNSLYILRGIARYGYSHELLPSASTFQYQNGVEKECVVTRERRISVIFRDGKEELNQKG
jgi:alkylated DNA repair protein alkB family protein 7